MLHQLPDQTRTGFIAGWSREAASRESMVQPSSIAPQRASSGVWLSSCKTLVAQALPILLRIGEDVVCQVHARPGRLGMQPTHVLDIPSQDSRLQVLGAKQVIGHEQELLILHPGVFDTYSRQPGARGRRGCVAGANAAPP